MSTSDGNTAFLGKQMASSAQQDCWQPLAARSQFYDNVGHMLA